MRIPDLIVERFACHKSPKLLLEKGYILHFFAMHHPQKKARTRLAFCLVVLPSTTLRELGRG